jgi:hypothetical protein
MPNYKSSGVIRCIFDGTALKVCLVADQGHTVKHDDKLYAVFSDGTEAILRKVDNVFLSLGPGLEGNEPLLHALISAATNQTEVDVEINGKFMLVGIAIPAK